MKHFTIAFCFSVSLVYCLFSIVGWSINAGDWSWQLRSLFGVFAFIFWIAFWMKIEADGEAWA